jgi:3-deoxy-7-phosphoheptulonate synthase
VIFIDGNSLKNHNNQPLVIHSIAEQLASTSPDSKAKHITGVMIESHINAGRQDVPPTGPADLKHGVSITDACVDWETTVKMLDELNEASGKRRAISISNGLQSHA